MSVPNACALPRPARARGFTLPELLLVVAVLAALASLGWSAYAGVQRDANEQLAHVQLQQLGDALRRLRQDTGYWPGAGPFALAAAANVETADGAGVHCSDTSAGLWLRSALPTLMIGSGDVEAWRGRWFEHPANLFVLATAPVLCANHPLARLQRWDAASARGWRGPYLRAEVLGKVDVGDGLSQTGGNPLAGELQQDLLGLPAGGALPALDAAGQPCTRTQTGCRWRWHTVASTASGYSAADHELRHPRPLLYFGPASGRVRVVWVGSDGRWGGFANNNPCEPDVSAEGGADDLVICLD